MKLTVSTAVEDLIRRTEPEIEFRLEAQEDALGESKCLNLIVGQWIDENGVEYLTSVLDLDDSDFAERFPSIAHLGHHRRQQMKLEVENHVNRCQHCSLKLGYELELDARILNVCRQNRTALLLLLDEQEMDLSEGEHEETQSSPSRSEHHPHTHSEPELIIEPLVEPI